jgi:amidase
MTRNVADAAHVLNVLAAPDPEDMAASNQPARVDYAKALMPDLKGVRIGIVREPSAGEASRALFEQAIDDLRGLGAILVDGVMLPEVSASWFAEHLEVMFTELKAQLPTYLAARRSRATVRTLADVIEASTRDRVQLPPLELAQQKGDISGAPYQRAFAHIRQISRADGIDGVLRAHRLDALVSPAMEPAWTFAEDETLELFLPRGMLLTSDAGYPAVTLPMGYVTGLPVGILLFGTAWSDAVLLRCAYAYEQATHHRKPPAPRA